MAMRLSKGPGQACAGVPRGRPTSSRAAQIPERLLDAAWTLLGETGPEHFSIDRLAASARASKKTIYARHANKRDLLEQLMARRLGLFLADMADLLPWASRTPQEAFAALARRHLAALVTGQGSLLEHLVDWLDSTDEGGTGRQAKAASYDQVLSFLERQMPETARSVGLTIAEPRMVASYWLDGIVGHSRTIQDFSESAIDRWAQGYAGLFLRAVFQR